MKRVSEYFLIAVTLSARVAPEIPAYALWKPKVALNPLEAWTYLQSIISGLYEESKVLFGLLIPTTQILSPSTSIFWNSV